MPLEQGPEPTIAWFIDTIRKNHASINVRSAKKVSNYKRNALRNSPFSSTVSYAGNWIEKHNNDFYTEHTDTIVRTQEWLLLEPDRAYTSHGRHFKESYTLDRKTKEVRVDKVNPSLCISSAILAGGYYNYYHTLVDYYLNILLTPAELSPSTPLLTLDTGHRYQREILESIGIHNPIIGANGIEDIYVENLLVPSGVVPGSTIISPQSRLSLERYLSRICDNGQVHKEKIYISRQSSNRRRFSPSFSERFEESLVSAGFQSLELEKLTFRDQVRIFRQARVILGLHGAGLGNMVFCCPGAKIIEIVPVEKESTNNHITYFKNLAETYEHICTQFSVYFSKDSTNIEMTEDQIQEIIEEALSS